MTDCLKITLSTSRETRGPSEPSTETKVIGREAIPIKKQIVLIPAATIMTRNRSTCFVTPIKININFVL